MDPMNKQTAKYALDYAIGVAQNVLYAVDQGMSTEQIRESLQRVKDGEAILGQDTRFFVLGLSSNATREGKENKTDQSLDSFTSTKVQP